MTPSAPSQQSGLDFDINTASRLDAHSDALAAKPELQTLFGDIHHRFLRYETEYGTATAGSEGRTGSGVYPLKRTDAEVFAAEVVVGSKVDLLFDAQHMPFGAGSVRACSCRMCSTTFPIRHYSSPKPAAFLPRAERSSCSNRTQVFSVDSSTRVCLNRDIRSTDARVAGSSERAHGRRQSGTFRHCVSPRPGLFDAAFPTLKVVAEGVDHGWFRYLASGGLNFRRVAPRWAFGLARRYNDVSVRSIACSGFITTSFCEENLPDRNERLPRPVRHRRSCHACPDDLRRSSNEARATDVQSLHTVVVRSVPHRARSTSLKLAQDLAEEAGLSPSGVVLGVSVSILLLALWRISLDVSTLRRIVATLTTNMATRVGDAGANSTTAIAVVVPAFNEARGRVVDTIRSARLACIVVDDGSTNATARLAGPPERTSCAIRQTLGLEPRCEPGSDSLHHTVTRPSFSAMPTDNIRRSPSKRWSTPGGQAKAISLSVLASPWAVVTPSRFPSCAVP